jgi:hypothetical protein
MAERAAPLRSRVADTRRPPVSMRGLSKGYRINPLTASASLRPMSSSWLPSTSISTVRTCNAPGHVRPAVVTP